MLSSTCSPSMSATGRCRLRRLNAFERLGQPGLEPGAQHRGQHRLAQRLGLDRLMLAAIVEAAAVCSFVSTHRVNNS
jgi:hypothetical protein